VSLLESVMLGVSCIPRVLMMINRNTDKLQLWLVWKNFLGFNIYTRKATRHCRARPVCDHFIVFGETLFHTWNKNVCSLIYSLIFFQDCNVGETIVVDMNFS